MNRRTFLGALTAAAGAALGLRGGGSPGGARAAALDPRDG